MFEAEPNLSTSCKKEIFYKHGLSHIHNEMLYFGPLDFYLAIELRTKNLTNKF